jgi:hypothetical protein
MRYDKRAAAADLRHFDDDFSADDEQVILDFSGPRWELIDHQPETKRRTRGVDPYNSVERPLRRQPWLRFDRR